MSNNIKNFNHHMWYQEEDGIITIGINDEGLAEISEITSVDLPQEQDKVEEDIAIGSIETDDGSLDIYAPVAGTVIEVNSNVIDDPDLIMDDPYEDGWLIRIESTEDFSDEDEDDEEDEEDEDDFDEDEDEELEEEDE